MMIPYQSRKYGDFLVVIYHGNTYIYIILDVYYLWIFSGYHTISYGDIIYIYISMDLDLVAICGDVLILNIQIYDKKILVDYVSYATSYGDIYIYIYII